MAAETPRTNASGSQTISITGPSIASGATEDGQPAAILRLRGAQRNDRTVQWAESVIDNEGLNRKKSKVCCIYHRPRAVDESSDSSSSDSDTDSSSDDDSDGGLAARSDADHAFRNRLGKIGDGMPASPHRHSLGCPGHGNGHGDDDGPGSGHDSSDDDDAVNQDKGHRGRGKGKGKGKAKEKRRPSPNAYEKMPRYSKPNRPPSP